MYTCEEIVGPSQVGVDGHQTLVSMVRAMQDCSQLWLESEPVMARFLERDGVAMLLASRQLDAIRFPKYGEHITVASGVYECKKYFGYRNTVIYDSEGALCAKSWAVGVFVSRATGKPVRIPDEVVRSMVYDPKVDMDYLGRKIIVPDLSVETLPPIETKRSDIDFNQHVNNAQYVRMALDVLPEEHRYQRMRVDYRQAARLGDTIAPRLIRSSDDGTVFVELGDAAEEKVFSVVELSCPEKAETA